MGRGQRGKSLPRFHGYSHIVFFFAGFCRRDSTFMVAGCTGFAGGVYGTCASGVAYIFFLGYGYSASCSWQWHFLTYFDYGYSARRSWQWYILSYTFKVNQNFKMAPGFGEAEGRWPCHSAPVAFFFWSGVRAAFCSFYSPGGYGERRQSQVRRLHVC